MSRKRKLPDAPPQRTDHETLSGSMRFEPHNLYGQTFKGEPMPFGYISTSPTPVPVFELNTPLAFEYEALVAFARRLAAANEMFAALKEISTLSAGDLSLGEQIFVVTRSRAAIAKAEGKPQ